MSHVIKQVLWKKMRFRSVMVVGCYWLLLLSVVLVIILKAGGELVMMHACLLVAAASLPAPEPHVSSPWLWWLVL